MTVEAHYTELRFASLVFFRVFCKWKRQQRRLLFSRKKIKNWKGNSEKMKKKINIFAKIGSYGLNRYRFESSILGTLDGAKYLPK